jgi:uncharacterized phiE125 gp8 family phage protein
MKQNIVTSQPAVEPLSLDEVKKNLEIDSTRYDQRLQNTIKSARQWCEEYANRSLISQVRSQYQDWFYDPCATSQNRNQFIQLMYGPLLSVSGTYVNYVKYYDENDTLQTLAASEYWVDFASRIPRIYVKTSWPSVKSRPSAVEINYNAGFGTEPDNVPGYFKDAMHLYVAHCFENRVPEIVGAQISRFELGIEKLLNMGTVYQNAI